MGLITYRDIVSNEDELKLLSVVDKLKDSSCVEKVYFTYDTDDHEEYPYIVDAAWELVIVVRDDTPQCVMNKLKELIQYDVDYEFVIINMKSYKVRRNKPGIEVLFDRNETIKLEDWQMPGFIELLKMIKDLEDDPENDPELEDETKEANDELKEREKKSTPEKPGQVSFEELIGEVRSFCNSFGENQEVTINVPEGWGKNPEAFIDKTQSTITDDTPTAPTMAIDVPVSYVNDLYGSIDQDSYENTLPYIRPTQGVLNDTDITPEDTIACGIAVPAEKRLYNAIFGNTHYQEECGNSRCRNKSGEYGDLS